MILRWKIEGKEAVKISFCVCSSFVRVQFLSFCRVQDGIICFAFCVFPKSQKARRATNGVHRSTNQQSHSTEKTTTCPTSMSSSAEAATPSATPPPNNNNSNNNSNTNNSSTSTTTTTTTNASVEEWKRRANEKRMLRATNLKASTTNRPDSNLLLKLDSNVKKNGQLVKRIRTLHELPKDSKRNIVKDVCCLFESYKYLCIFLCIF